MVHETSSFCFFLVVGSTTTFSKLQLYYLQRRTRAFSLLPLLLKAGALPQPLPGISYARGGKVAPGASAKTPGARVVSGLDRRHVFETRVFDVYRFSIFDFFVPARFAQDVVFIHALGTLKRVLTFRSERVCRP